MYRGIRQSLVQDVREILDSHYESYLSGPIAKNTDLDQLVAKISELQGKEVIVVSGAQNQTCKGLEFQKDIIRKVELKHLWYNKGQFATGIDYIFDVVPVEAMRFDKTVDDQIKVYSFRGQNGSTEYYCDAKHFNPVEAANSAIGESNEIYRLTLLEILPVLGHVSKWKVTDREL